MGLLSESSGGPTVGLDIGSSLIKVVEARPGKDGIQITALGIAPTPPGAIENEIIVDPQTLGRAVRQLLSESGILCKRSVSSVSGQSSVIVRIIEVPKMTRQELAETMKWEIERHVPFAANEVVMDFQPIERPTASPGDQNMEVLLAVAQQEVIGRHLETLFAAGLEPAAIDVEPLAASRALIEVAGNGAREQTIAIVNIGALATELAVFEKGLLAFPRTLPIAGDAVTRALSNSLRIPIEQAERLKRERAAVLLDRAAQLSPPGGVPGVQPVGGFEEPEGTVGLSAPAEEAPDAGLGYIPGLGYGSSPEGLKADTGEGGLPDFDIDIGAPAAEPAEPVIDFDLSIGEDFAAPPKPQLDLSEPAGGDTGEASLPAPAPIALSPLGEGGPEEQKDFSQEVIFDAMSPVLNDLIAEIRRSLEYYVSRFQNQPARILLCGGTAKMKDLDKLLQNELGIPVTIANPLQNVTVFSRSLSEGYLGEVAAIFPVSVGLAIRDMIGE